MTGDSCTPASVEGGAAPSLERYDEDGDGEGDCVPLLPSNDDVPPIAAQYSTRLLGNDWNACALSILHPGDINRLEQQPFRSQLESSSNHGFHGTIHSLESCQWWAGRHRRLIWPALNGEEAQFNTQSTLHTLFSHEPAPRVTGTVWAHHEARDSGVDFNLGHETSDQALLEFRVDAPLLLAPNMNPQFHPASQSSVNDFDDGALPVDHPRHNYDFMDFMDQWRSCLQSDKRLPRFEHGTKPFVQLQHLTAEVTHDIVEAGYSDIQGIRWPPTSPSRNDAFRARAMLRPESAHSVHRYSSELFAYLGPYENQQYRFRAFLPKHIARTKHFQLRNCLTAISRSEIFYATGSAVNHAMLACPAHSETVLDMTHSTSSSAFKITCLSSGRAHAPSAYHTKSILLAGGFDGEYAMLDLDDPSRKLHEGFITHAYNGLVTHVQCFPDRHSNDLRAAFCSNDCKLRILDVSHQLFTHEFVYDHAMNCSATSFDGCLRALAGDSCEVLIADADRGTPVVTLKGFRDHCFACDWSPDGRYVAAASQDQTTVIWDARNWSVPIGTLHGVMSCARSLHFTDKDALIVAESDDVVTVYEGRGFEPVQEFRFFGSIAGVALLDGGTEVIVANADRTVGGLLTFETKESWCHKHNNVERTHRTGGAGISRFSVGFLSSVMV